MVAYFLTASSVYVCVRESVCLSYHSILVLFGSNDLHDARYEPGWGCQQGGSSVHNGLAALGAPAGLPTIDLEAAVHHTFQTTKLVSHTVTLPHKIIINLGSHLTLHVDKNVERFRPFNGNLPVALSGDRGPVDVAPVQAGVHCSERHYAALFFFPKPTTIPNLVAGHISLSTVTFKHLVSDIQYLER